MTAKDYWNRLSISIAAPHLLKETLVQQHEDREQRLEQQQAPQKVEEPKMKSRMGLGMVLALSLLTFAPAMAEDTQQLTPQQAQEIKEWQAKIADMQRDILAQQQRIIANQSAVEQSRQFFENRTQKP